MPLTVKANMIQGAGQIIPDSSGQAYRNPADNNKDNAVSFADMMKSSMSQRQDFAQNARTASGSDDQLSGFNVQSPLQSQTGSDKAGTGSNTSLKNNSPDRSSGKDTLPQETIEAASQAVTDIADGVTENVTDELDIANDDLDEVMETLELAYLDLLNPQALTQVVETVSEDALTLEADVDVSAIVDGLVPANEEVIAAALEDNGISLDEFSEFFSQVQTNDIEIPEEVAELLPTSVPEDTDGLPEMTAALLEPASETLQTEGAVTDQRAGGPVVDTASVTVIRIDDDAFDNNALLGTAVKDESFDGAKLTGDMTGVLEPQAAQELADELGAAVDTINAAMEEEAPVQMAVSSDEALLAPEDMTTEETGDDIGAKGTSILDNITGAVVDEMTDENASMDFGASDNRQGFQMGAGQDTAASAMNVRNDLMADAAAIAQQQNTFAETLSETAAQTPVTPYTAAQTADIMNQIVTQASVTINETVQRMEMELNPQNLGRMIMQVQQQEGVVTARLIAQNDNVRNAIENQLLQLRENLEQKGIKVDAVEVTVGTHEFERNLEEGMADQAFAEQQENEAGQNNGSGRNRNLNRGDLDSMAGDLTEEEELAASIMRDNGGTIDYTA